MLKANLITARSRHVPHPLDTTVIALLKDLEIAHQQAAAREHQQAKRHTQGRPTPGLLVRHARQLRFCAQDEFTATDETGDFPDDAVRLGLIFRFALGGALGDFGGVEWGRDANDDVGGEEFGAVVGFDSDAILDFGGTDFAHDGVHSEWEVDVFDAAVAHHFEFAVRWHEGDGAVRVEFAQLDALVELAVFERDGAGGRARCFAFAVCVADGAVGADLSHLAYEKLVVEAEFAFGRAGEVGAHHDLARHVGAEHGACGGHEEVDVFDHVDEGFVLAVLDVATAPGLSTCGLHGDLGGIGGRGGDRADGGGKVVWCDVHFEDIDVCVLGVAEVKDLWKNG